LEKTGVVVILHSKSTKFLKAIHN